MYESFLVKKLIALGILICASASAAAQTSTGGNPTVAERAAALGPGQYVWAAKSPSAGPVFLTINLTAQRVMVYRDGVLMAASAISTGSLGRETPTGVFTVLEKQVMHRSTTYDDAPMPYMQRLTSKGIAIHAGDLPGYAASHGCIRLPNEFAKKLYGITQVGTPVMIIDDAEIAEQKRKQSEFQRASEEYSQAMADQQAAANRALIEFNKRKAAHEALVKQHEAEVAKYKSETASR